LGVSSCSGYCGAIAPMNRVRGGGGGREWEGKIIYLQLLRLDALSTTRASVVYHLRSIADFRSEPDLVVGIASRPCSHAARVSFASCFATGPMLGLVGAGSWLRLILKFKKNFWVVWRSLRCGSTTASAISRLAGCGIEAPTAVSSVHGGARWMLSSSWAHAARRPSSCSPASTSIDQQMLGVGGSVWPRVANRLARGARRHLGYGGVMEAASAWTPVRRKGGAAASCCGCRRLDAVGDRGDHSARCATPCRHVRCPRRAARLSTRQLVVVSGARWGQRIRPARRA